MKEEKKILLYKALQYLYRLEDMTGYKNKKLGNIITTLQAMKFRK